MILTPDDYKAMIECSYEIGDKSMKTKKEPLVESKTNSEISLFESIGDSVPQKEEEVVDFFDGVALKFNIREK